MADKEHPLLKALVPEQQALVGELTAIIESSPAYARLRKINDLVSEYGGEPVWVGAPVGTAVIAPVARARQRGDVSVAVTGVAAQVETGKSAVRQFGYGQKTKAIEETAIAFLTARGRRASSAEILPAINAARIPLSGQSQRRTLASFLTTSPCFNNLSPYGYGLAEWGEKGLGPKAKDGDGIVSFFTENEDSEPEVASAENAPHAGNTGGGAETGVGTPSRER